MEDCVNEELDDNGKNDFNKENDTGLEDEYGEKSTDNENEDVIHSNMNENK